LIQVRFLGLPHPKRQAARRKAMVKKEEKKPAKPLALGKTPKPTSVISKRRK
jgi:hypothetical protein